MSLNWEAFKAQAGFCQNACFAYIDEEGSEIPIESDYEFQEAIRWSNRHKNCLNLIIKDDKLYEIQKKFENPIKCKCSVATCESSISQNLNNEKLSKLEHNLKGDILTSVEDLPPAWFTHFMERFKEDLLSELKSEIIDIFENVVSKNKALPNLKSDTANELIFFDKSETQFSPFTCQPSCSTVVQNRKKRKVSEKDIMDLTRQREVKIPKRLEKLREKSERLEKLCSKTRVVLEEKKRLLERILYFKQKLDRMGVVVSDKKNLRKSASFREHEVCLFLTPGGEFTLNVNIINDGNIAWSAPRLECYDFTGLQIQESIISLPKLLPMESCVATLRGKAAKTIGLQHFKCILVEGAKKIGSEFTCWATVDFFEGHEKCCKVLVSSNEAGDTITRSEDSVDEVIDFEKDVIASSEKKIEENIIEIEKRLQDLDLIRSSPVKEATLKIDAGKPKEICTKKLEELETVNCDLLQIPEEKEKNWKERLEQEEVTFGIDCLGMASENSDVCSLKMSEINEGNEESKKDGESESSCDSELSVICMSEEDETFFVVPLPSKSPSPTQTVHEDKKSLSKESIVQPSVICIEPDIIRINNKLTKPNTNTMNDFYSSQLSPARTRRSSLGEISESKPKKMKSESTEYRFTAANLTQPTFTPIPEGFLEKRPSKFTFTGEKEEKSHSEGTSEGRPSRFTFVKEKEEEDIKGRNIPKTDALGRVIYAVSVKGICLPVRDVFGDGEYCKSPEKENRGKKEQRNPNQSEKRNDRFSEVLPTALMSGASNVASLAFNTAKSVINNLQSAFMPGMTEPKTSAYEDQKLTEAMFKLCEMGFSDIQLNRKLLLLHDNNLMKVVEELVRIKKMSPD